LARVPHVLHAFGVIILAEHRRRRGAAVEGIAGRQTTLHAPGRWAMPGAPGAISRPTPLYSITSSATK